MSPVPDVGQVIHREPYVPQEDDMRIRMLATRTGSRTGQTVERFQEGVEYDVPSDLGLVFVGQLGVAEMVEVKEESASEVGPSETPAAGPSETKEEEKLEWTLATAPEKYLEKWPEGPKAELAKKILGQE